MKTNSIFSLAIALIFWSSCHLKSNKVPDNSAVHFNKVFGGSGEDYFNLVTTTTDGGLLIVGSTRSSDGDVVPTGKHRGVSAWVVKLNDSGSIVWQKTFGGSNLNHLSSIISTPGGDYVLAGATDRNDLDTSDKYGGADAWVIKLDSTGSIVWQKILGGSENDYANSITTTGDGGYLMAGTTLSQNGDVIPSARVRSPDPWIVKFNSSGSIEWQKRLSDVSDTIGVPKSITRTSGGGYILAGNTYTNNHGDVSGPHGVEDAWVVKLDSSANIVWQKVLGGSSSDYAASIATSSENGYFMAGYTSSNDGDVSGNHGLWDAWVVKLDSTGRLLWQKTLGGSSSDYAKVIIPSSDAGCIMAGYKIIKDGIVTGIGDNDAWVVKLNAFGVVVWEKTFGSLDFDEAETIIEMSDSSYVVAGSTNNNDKGIRGDRKNDACVMKFRYP
jgi:hypothetical protein